MQNTHVTSFSNEEQGYPEISQENGNPAAYAIDPSLEQWTATASDTSQYVQPQYAVPSPQYQYLPQYGQAHPQQQQQQPVYQQNYGSIAQASPYTSFETPAPRYLDPSFFAGTSPQGNFASRYGFSAQTPQQETISPSALQVNDRIGNDGGVVQNSFHRDLNTQYGRNPQQDPWAQERVIASSSNRHPDLASGHVISNQNQPITQTSRTSLGYNSFTSPSIQRGGADSSVPGFDPRAGYPSTTTSNALNTTVPQPNPLRITNQSLLNKYSEGDTAHRVANVPFVVLGENAIQFDIRGKTTIPKYKARASNSIGTTFAPRNDLFATRSSTVSKVKKAPRAPKIKQASTKSNIVKSKAVLSSNKARQLGYQLSIKQLDSPSTPSLASSSGESSSDEDSETDESEEEEEMNETLSWSDVRGSLPPSKEDIVAYAEYEAIGTVFKEGVQHGSITRDEVIKAVTAYEPFILKLRDTYRKSAADLLEATSQKKPQIEITKCTDTKLRTSRAIINALTATTKYGHRDIVMNLGTNHKLVGVLWSFVTDSVKAEDFASELLLNVLELLVKFTGFTPELLKKLKFEAVQKRFLRKGTEKGKELIAMISKIATEANKRENENPTDSGPLQKTISQSSRESSTLSTTPRTTAGMKRPHEGEGANGSPAKKTAPGTKSISTSTLRQGTTAAKPVPQPNFFATLTRPTKLSQTSNGGNKPVTKTAPPKPVAKPAPPMITSRASFRDLIDSIEAPKQLPKAPVVPQGPPETAEEKKNRERKESRRHLRVKWKEGDDLTEVKIFMQVEGEDDARKGELVRDAHDDRSEGMMHKQRAQEEVDMDEDEASGEVEFRPYPEPIAIDFSSINEAERSKSYTTRGGLQTFSTLQQQIQNHHESMELMVVYTDPSDIPHSAKEPPDLDEQPREEKILSTPNEPWLHQRMAEVRNHGPEVALHMALSRLRRDSQNVGSTNTPNFNATPQQQIPFTTPFVNSVQNYTMSSNQNTESDHAAKVMDLVNSITTIIKPIIGKPFPANEPPYHMNERQKAEWWEGYYKDHPEARPNSVPQQSTFTPMQQPQAAIHQPQMQYQPQPAVPTAAPAAFDIQSLMRQVQIAQAQIQQQQATPVYSQPQQQAVPAFAQTHQQAAPAFDVQRYMSSITPNVAAPPQQQANQPGWPAQHANSAYSFGAIPTNAMAWNNGGVATADNRYGNPQAGGNNPMAQGWGMQGVDQNNWADNNKMQWERTGAGDENMHTRGGFGGGGAGGGRDNKGKSQKQKAPYKKEQNPQLLGYKERTQPCKFFKEGKCAKGDKCTFIHTMD